MCFCGLPISIVEKTEILAVALQSLNCRIAFDVDTVGPSVPWTFTPADIQVPFFRGTAFWKTTLIALESTLARSDHAAGHSQVELIDVQCGIGSCCVSGSC